MDRILGVGYDDGIEGVRLLAAVFGSDTKTAGGTAAEGVGETAGGDEGVVEAARHGRGVRWGGDGKGREGRGVRGVEPVVAVDAAEAEAAAVLAAPGVDAVDGAGGGPFGSGRRG